jgi:hypothetical protein
MDMIRTFLALAALLPHPGLAGPVQVRRYAQDGWTLSTAKDSFSGVTTCRLSRRHMHVWRGALGFSTAARSRVGIWYSVDGGPPRRWEDLRESLADAGIPIDADEAGTSSAGTVWIPIEVVASAATMVIDVPTEHGRRLHRFGLASFANMHAAALRLGCAQGFET